MFLSDVSSLQRLSSRPQTLGGAAKSGTLTINDSEIERMYNISPVINDWSRSYQNDEALYTVDNEVCSLTCVPNYPELTLLFNCSQAHNPEKMRF